MGAEEEKLGDLRSAFPRHARPCAGHPRLDSVAARKDVDGRDKPGHDKHRKDSA
jgi:hypothetical protein